MKLAGGEKWSLGDALALIGVVVTIVGIWIAHQDAKEAIKPTPRDQNRPAPQPSAARLRAVSRNDSASSGQVNFGCEESQHVITPEIPLGVNARDIHGEATWIETDNVKSHNQSVEYRNDAAGHVLAIKGTGDIRGLDKNLFGNCPGGGHGKLSVHATWTEDQSLQTADAER